MIKRTLDKIALTIGLVLIAPWSYATGPGFRDDVTNWSNQYSNDDDGSNGGDDGNSGDDGCNNSNEIPLDGGLGLLGAAGVAYGIKRLRDHKKEK